MKTKQFYILVIAVIFIAAMIIYHNQMTIIELVLAFVSSGGTIGWIYQWLITDNQKEEKLSWRGKYFDEYSKNIELTRKWDNQLKSQEKTSQDT